MTRMDILIFTYFCLLLQLRGVLMCLQCMEELTVIGRNDKLITNRSSLR